MSASSQKTDKKCIKCNVLTRKISGTKKYIDNYTFAADLSEFLNKPVVIDDFICSTCYSSYRYHLSLKTKIEKQQTIPNEPDSQESVASTSSSQFSSGDLYEPVDLTTDLEKELIELPFKRTISTHKYCFICGLSSKIVDVPFEARKQIFSDRRVFVPRRNRCCSKHLIKKRFYTDQMDEIRIISSSCFIEKDEVTKLLEVLSISTDRELLSRIGDFTISEERLITFTGLKWEDLIRLREMMISMRNSENRDITQAIVVFLFKLRSGNSNNLISAILGLERPQQVTEFSSSVIKSFEEDILPSQFGIKAYSRSHLLSQTSPITNKLHNIANDQLVLIADGTYIRHEKSQNNEYQRKSYSGQKKVPLCKPFTICTSNGFIVDIVGPFNANINDAKILESIMEEPSGLKDLLQEGDVFVLDRGFRDVVSSLENKNFIVLMPALKGKRNQLTAKESNDSRRVTMIRWVVEAVHGVIGQKYKLLHNQFDNKLLPKAAALCKIAGFMVNTFGKRFVSSFSSSDEVIAQVNDNIKDVNTLDEEVKEGKWSRRKLPLQKLTSSEILDFPELTEKDLKIFFTGTYQLQQSISYLAEMLKDKEEIDLEYVKETPQIIKIQVRSRHISSKTYRCFIHYKPNSIGYHSILRHCCECANGLRTIGCCSHVAAVIYYLSHARYQSRIVRPSEKLTKIFERENVMPVINDDSDED